MEGTCPLSGPAGVSAEIREGAGPNIGKTCIQAFLRKSQLRSGAASCNRNEDEGGKRNGGRSLIREKKIPTPGSIYSISPNVGAAALKIKPKGNG